MQITATTPRRSPEPWPEKTSRWKQLVSVCAMSLAVSCASAESEQDDAAGLGRPITVADAGSDAGQPTVSCVTDEDCGANGYCKKTFEYCATRPSYAIQLGGVCGWQPCTTGDCVDRPCRRQDDCNSNQTCIVPFPLHPVRDGMEEDGVCDAQRLCGYQPECDPGCVRYVPPHEWACPPCLCPSCP